MAVYLIQGGTLQGSLPVPAELSPTKGLLLVNYETPGEDPFAIGAGSDSGMPYPPSYPIDPAPNCEMIFQAGTVSASIITGWSNLLSGMDAKVMQIRFTYVPAPGAGAPRMALRLAGGLMQVELPGGAMVEPLSMRVSAGSYQLVDATGVVQVDITPTMLQDHIDANEALWPDSTPVIYDPDVMAPLGFAATTIATGNESAAHTDGGDAMIDVIYDGLAGASTFWTDFYLATEGA